MIMTRSSSQNTASYLIIAAMENCRVDTTGLKRARTSEVAFDGYSLAIEESDRIRSKNSHGYSLATAISKDELRLHRPENAVS
jgi:hypothetical protein